MSYLQTLYSPLELSIKLVGHTYTGELLATRYRTAHLALALEFVDFDGEIITTISTNLDTPPSAPHRFWLKNWSENENIEDFLLEYNIATPTERARRSGFVVVEEWELTPGYANQLITPTTQSTTGETNHG